MSARRKTRSKNKRETGKMEPTQFVRSSEQGSRTLKAGRTDWGEISTFGRKVYPDVPVSGINLDACFLSLKSLLNIN
jgi:hypothetical protein